MSQAPLPGTAYAETLDFLFERLPMYQRVGPVAYKKDLGNILALMRALGRPHNRFASVHIAGTNGKGSVAHGMAAVLQAAGYRVGLYTSPHLHDFRERIRLQGEPVSEAEVVDFVDRVRPLIDKYSPSFFEITVAMAFDRFAAWEVDIAVVETGLGGRLDSTNIIHPLVSIITSIGHDHQAMLGPDLPSIAREKAGIIKPGVPLVLGEYREETYPVFRQTAEGVQAPLYLAPETVQLNDLEVSMEGIRASWQRPGLPPLADLHFGLGAAYQVGNLRCILQAGALLERHGLNIPDTAWKIGLAQVKAMTGFRGRWDVLQQNPLVLVDGAHNPEGLNAFFSQVAQLPASKLHVVTGTVNDKDLDKVLPCFPQKARYYFARPNVPRGLDALLLRDQAVRFGLIGEVYASIPAALDTAIQQADKDDAVIVCGSLFAVAEVPYERWEA
jgi:dihydrofolate synthase/folylpolyglutamate synthase